jgi:hypothetical protein
MLLGEQSLSKHLVASKSLDYADHIQLLLEFLLRLHELEVLLEMRLSPVFGQVPKRKAPKDVFADH